MNLNSFYPSLIFWLSFVIISQLCLKSVTHFFNGTTPYNLIILSCFFLYAIVKKKYVQNAKPDFVSIAPEKIYFKSLWGNGKRKLNNLQAIRYNIKQNFIELQFQEGLDNIKLPLTDYEISDIYKFLKELKQIKGASLGFDKDFADRFEQIVFTGE